MSKERKRDPSTQRYIEKNPKSTGTAARRIRKHPTQSRSRSRSRLSNPTRTELRQRLNEYQGRQRAFQKRRQAFLNKVHSKKPHIREVEDLKLLSVDDRYKADNDDDMDMDQMDYEKMKNRLEIAQKKNKKLEEEKQSLKHDKDQTMRTIENLLSQNRDLTSENASLRDRQRKDARAIESLKKSVHLLEARMQKIKEENKILNEANLKAMKELQSMNIEKKELNKSFKGQNEEINKLLQDKEKDSSKLHVLENRQTKLKTALADQTQTISDLQNELKKYKQIVIDLKEEIESLKSSNVGGKMGKPDSIKSSRSDNTITSEKSSRKRH